MREMRRKIGGELEGIPLDAEHLTIERHLNTPVGPYSFYGFENGDIRAYFMNDSSIEGGLVFLSWGLLHGETEFYARIQRHAAEERASHELEVRRMERLETELNKWQGIRNVTDLTSYVDTKSGEGGTGI